MRSGIWIIMLAAGLGTALFAPPIWAQQADQSVSADKTEETERLFDLNLDVKGFVEGRVVFTNDRESIFDLGSGRFRYGAGREGFQFGELALDANLSLTHELSVFTSVRLSEDATSQADVLEAFIRYKPASLSRWRWGFRAGAFFPEISFENQGTAWSNRFTLTNSAANTWYGEEYRPIGLEASVERRSREITWTAAASLYFGNDRAGTALSFRGFTLNDQRIGLFGSLPLSNLPPQRENVFNSPFVESDNRPGVFLQVGFKSDQYGRFSLHATDNRADSSVVGSQGRLWRVRFINAAYESKPLENLTLGSQFLFGESITSNTGNVADRYGTEYLAFQILASYQLGPLRLSTRPEYFKQDTVEDTAQPVLFNHDEEGFALTTNATLRFLKRHEVAAEFVLSTSDRQQTFMGPRAPLDETQFILNYRFRF